MKRSIFLSLYTFIIFSFLFQSCTEDADPIIGGGNNNPPSLTLLTGNDNVTVSAIVDAGKTFKVSLQATPGTALLKTLRILENGTLINLDRIVQNGQPISANPKLILGIDKNGINYELIITSQNIQTMSSYSFEVVDDEGLKASKEVEISTMVKPPTFNNNSSGTFQVAPGALVSLSVDAIAGSSELTFIVIGDQNDDVIDDFSRFYYGDLNTPFDDNPFRIPMIDYHGFKKNILIRAHTTPGPLDYRIFLFDNNEMAAFIDIKIIAGTPTNNIFGVLFNAAGPVGNGGLDLDEGLGTGSKSLLAEIKDEGIDLNQAITENWKKQISGVNGSMVKSLLIGTNGLSENYSFTNSFLRSDLKVLYEAGTDFIATNSAAELVSPKVKVGESFAVKNGSNYYLIYIREVNETGNNNSDNYVIDIKQ